MTAMLHFCTYFDNNYLPRALALYASMTRHVPAFTLYALCMDDEAYARLSAMNLPSVRPIALADFERGDDALVAVKNTRSRLEYYFTCSPSLPLYIFREFPGVDVVTYVDADMYFYADPTPVVDDFADYSISFVPHHQPEFLRGQYDLSGKYNVGWLSYRNDETGRQILQWWRDQCIAWCYEKFEDGKYADQQYLDAIVEQFPRVQIISHYGVNAGPWNVGDYRVTLEDGRPMLSGQPLVLFHFHGFRQVSRRIYNSNFGISFRPLTRAMRDGIVAPYVLSLRAAAGGEGYATATMRKKRLRAAWVQMVRDVAKVSLGLAMRQYVVVVGDKVW